MLCDDCSSCFSPCLTVPHTKTYKKYQLGGSDIYISTILPNHPEKHPMTIRFLSRRQPQLSPPSASHPRRPRRDGAASGGWRRPRRRGWAADLCWGQGGRDPQRRPWPRKGFRVVLGVALTRWRKGFVHGQLIFVLCFGMLSGIRILVV